MPVEGLRVRRVVDRATNRRGLGMLRMRVQNVVAPRAVDEAVISVTATISPRARAIASARNRKDDASCWNDQTRPGYRSADDGQGRAGAVANQYLAAGRACLHPDGIERHANARPWLMRGNHDGESATMIHVCRRPIVGFNAGIGEASPYFAPKK